MFRLLSFFIALLLSVSAASAATFQAKRGISLDIWVTWPDESKWGDESVLLPFPEWRKTVGEKELGDLKAAGFDFVRMPIDPSPFLSEKSAALHDKLFEEVAASVDLVTNAGLKVIVDLHALPAGGNRSIGTSEILKDGKLFEAHAALVKRMAAMLTDHIPESVALELFNEPTIDCEDEGTNDWPAKAESPARSRPQRHLAADADPLRRLLGRLGGAGEAEPEGLRRRQHHLVVPFLRPVHPHPSGRDLDRRFHAPRLRPALSAA